MSNPCFTNQILSQKTLRGKKSYKEQSKDLRPGDKANDGVRFRDSGGLMQWPRDERYQDCWRMRTWIFSTRHSPPPSAFLSWGFIEHLIIKVTGSLFKIHIIHLTLRNGSISLDLGLSTFNRYPRLFWSRWPETLPWDLLATDSLIE